jgi:hypothetical protein
MVKPPPSLAEHQISLTGWKIGETVPWSVGWTGEQSFSLRPSLDFPGKIDLVQVQNPGEGTPKFAQMHIMRHRLGMTDHVCHVCGRKTDKSDRFIFPVQTGAIMPVIGTTGRYVGNVPPVHLACAKQAQRLCPHLVHHTASPVRYPAEESLVKPRMDVIPGMESLAATLPPGAKIVYGCVRLYGPRFTRLVEKLRKAHAA